MARPSAFANFPSGPSYNSDVSEFKRPGDIAAYEWYASGHSEPDTLTNQSGGALTLGGDGSMVGDYVQGQKFSGDIKFDRLAKIYYFEWKIQLSSATLCNAVASAQVTNTNIFGGATADGIGFFNYSGSWYPWSVATGSFLPSTAPTVAALAACTTTQQTFALQVATDGSTTGAGQATWYIDGVQKAVATYSSLGLTQQLLRMTLAMSNSTAVAQNLITAGIFTADQV